MQPLSTCWSRKGVWGPWLLLLAFWGVKTSQMWRQLTTAHFAMPYDLYTRNPLYYIDTIQMYSLTWWTSLWAWEGKPSLLHSDLINYPLGGTSILDYCLAWLHTALAGIIEPFVGASAAINLVAIAGLAVSLVAIFLLVRAVSGSGLLGAALSILVVTYGIARGNTLPDPELVLLAYMAFGLLAWMRYLERGGWRWLLLAGFLVAVTGFVHAYYGMALLSCLGVAAVLPREDLAFAGVGGRNMWRRTLLVVGVGLVMTLGLHAHNIGNLLAVNRAEAVVNAVPLLWPYTLQDGVLVLAGLLAPALVAWARRIPNAPLWGLMFAPVAVISLGFTLHVKSTGATVDMPLEWARQHLPIFWRLTFPQRFVAPLVLGMAVVYAALWRGLADSAFIRIEGERFKGWVSGLLVVSAFWLTAAVVPLAPDTSPLSLGPRAGGPNSPPGTQVQASLAGRLSALSWLFQPVAMLRPPATPACIQRLADEAGKFAILELTRDTHAGYLAYFQTIHGKAVAGFPCMSVQMAARNNTLSELTLLQQEYREGKLVHLPDADWLRELGVRYVVRYEVPPMDGQPPADDRAPAGFAPGGVDGIGLGDFEEAYGKPACTDELTRIYSTGGK